MSSILGMANALATWKRSTSSVLDSTTAAASHAPDRQPVRASCAQVQLGGSPSGTVTVAGTVQGAADTEVLAWTGTAGTRCTVKQFTAISGITTSLSGATTIAVEAVGPGGQPQATTYTLKSGHPVMITEDRAPSWLGQPPGHERKRGATCRVQYEETWAPRQGDVVVLGTGETWEVVGTPRPGGDLYPEFWLVKLEQREGR